MKTITILCFYLLLGCSVEHGNTSVDSSPTQPRRGPAPRPDSAPSADTSTSEASTFDSTANSDIIPDLGVDLAHDTSSDLTLDTTTDLAKDLLVPDLGVDLAHDTSSDLTPDVTADLAKDLLVPDTTPRSPLGTNCGSSSQCSSGFCTDNVCCPVAKCVDTCVPGSGTTCPTYNGFTCAPLGSCRAY